MSGKYGWSENLTWLDSSWLKSPSKFSFSKFWLVTSSGAFVIVRFKGTLIPKMSKSKVLGPSYYKILLISTIFDWRMLLIDLRFELIM